MKNCFSERPELSYEGWVEALRLLKGLYSPVHFDPAYFSGSVGSRTVFGLEAVGIRANIPRVERTQSDARRDGFDCYYAVFQTAGRSTVVQDEIGAELSAGDVAFVDSSRAATYLGHESDAQWLSLILPRATLISHLGFAPKFGKKPNNISIAKALFGLISHPAEEQVYSDPSGEWTRLAVYDLVGALCATPPCAHTTSHTEKIFERVCGIIRSRFADPDLSPQDIASEAGISLRYLQKLFTVRHSTFGRFVTSLRLEHATRLIQRRTLTKSEQPLNMIAFASGYREYPQFARAFRRRFGRSPGSPEFHPAAAANQEPVRSNAGERAR